MMRIGTFAAVDDDESVYPDSSFEGYGFYSMKRPASVVAVFFGGPAELKSRAAWCDGTPVRADISLPWSGLYFFIQRLDGAHYEVAPLTDTSNLAFAVMTASEAYLDFASEPAARASCDRAAL